MYQVIKGKRVYISPNGGFRAVAEDLQAVYGLKAEAIHTGGGIVCVNIVIGESAFLFGTADEFWAGDVLSLDGDYQGEQIDLNTSSEERNCTKVARDIVVALLARYFCIELENDIGKAKVRLAALRNRTEELEGCCASHDFCDANMTGSFLVTHANMSYMMAAFEKVGIPCLTNQPDEYYDSPAHIATLDLWNDAWDLAKANGPRTHRRSV